MTTNDSSNATSLNHDETETFETAWDAGWEGGWDVGFEDGCDAAADLLIEAAIEAGFRAGLEVRAEFRDTLATASRGDRIRIMQSAISDVQDQFETEREQRAILEARRSFEASPHDRWIGSDPAPATLT